MPSSARKKKIPRRSAGCCSCSAGRLYRPRRCLEARPTATLPFSSFTSCFASRWHLHSFPTRRSSDLLPTRRPRCWSTTRNWSWFPRRARAGFHIGHSIPDRKSTRLNSSHLGSSYAVFCSKKKNPAPFRGVLQLQCWALVSAETVLGSPANRNPAVLLFYFLLRFPLASTLFPYTTLFRSAADSPPALLVYDAELELVSATGSRWVPYRTFHT